MSDNKRDRRENPHRRPHVGHQAADPGGLPLGINQLLLGDGDGGSGGGGASSAEVALLYAPFHAYTMRNAVQDGFVLDVLRSYTAVTARVQIDGLRAEGGDGRCQGDDQKLTKPYPRMAPGLNPAGTAGGDAIAEDVLVEAASNSRDVVERKAAYIVQRFVAMWRRASAAAFTSFRGMVVARSRQHVVWFVQALRRAVSEEPEFQRLAEAAMAADPVDAARSQRGPPVFGAFSGTIPMSAEQALELEQQCRQWRQAAGRRTGGCAAGVEFGVDAADTAEAPPGAGSGEAGGGEGPPRKRRRREDAGGGGGNLRHRHVGHGNVNGRRARAASAWDAALSHLTEKGNTDESDEEGDPSRPRPPGASSSLLARGGSKCIDGDGDAEVSYRACLPGEIDLISG
ncbi:hypothetical protein Vretimale_9325, partial [Volvox reticuliferus]